VITEWAGWVEPMIHRRLPALGATFHFVLLPLEAI
jgi:hypothetical protein